LPGVAVRKLTGQPAFSAQRLGTTGVCLRAGRELEIPLDATESAEEALESADMLITATNAPTPVCKRQL